MSDLIQDLSSFFFYFDCLTLKPFKKLNKKKQTNKQTKIKRENDVTKKKSLGSITKFHSDDIDYNITRRNYELVIPEADRVTVTHL